MGLVVESFHFGKPAAAHNDCSAQYEPIKGGRDGALSRNADLNRGPNVGGFERGVGSLRSRDKDPELPLKGVHLR